MHTVTSCCNTRNIELPHAQNAGQRKIKLPSVPLFAACRQPRGSSTPSSFTRVFELSPHLGLDV
uniref:Uncharacterized protein n=1 Tax=Mesocestoides corti TaxID=53468 RepID=A0A5K3F8V5_MESCO